MRHTREAAHVRDACLEKLVAAEIAAILASADDLRLAALTVVRVEARRGAAAFDVLFGPPAGAPADYPEIGGAAAAAAALARAAGFVRAELAVALPLKRVPELRFLAEPVAWAGWEDERARE